MCFQSNYHNLQCYVQSLSRNDNDRSLYHLILHNDVYLPFLTVLLNVETLFVSEDKISYIIFFEYYFNCFTLIDEFELLVDDLAFLDKVEGSSISCDEMTICFGAVLFGSIETSSVLMSIKIVVMKVSLVPESFLK